MLGWNDSLERDSTWRKMVWGQGVFQLLVEHNFSKRFSETYSKIGWVPYFFNSLVQCPSSAFEDSSMMAGTGPASLSHMAGEKGSGEITSCLLALPWRGLCPEHVRWCPGWPPPATCRSVPWALPHASTWVGGAEWLALPWSCWGWSIYNPLPQFCLTSLLCCQHSNYLTPSSAPFLSLFPGWGMPNWRVSFESPLPTPGFPSVSFNQPSWKNAARCHSDTSIGPSILFILSLTRCASNRLMEANISS